MREISLARIAFAIDKEVRAIDAVASIAWVPTRENVAAAPSRGLRLTQAVVRLPHDELVAREGIAKTTAHSATRSAPTAAGHGCERWGGTEGGGPPSVSTQRKQKIQRQKIQREEECSFLYLFSHEINPKTKSFSESSRHGDDIF